MAAPNSVEVGLLSEFRKRFKAGELNENQTGDFFLISWIRARNGNLNKAEQMLRESLKYRAENDLDNILSWECPQEIKELVPIYVVGDDPDNCPIIVLKTGKFQLPKMAKSGQLDVAAKYFDFMFEQVNAQCKGRTQRDGTPVTQFTLISDFKGFSFKNLSNIKVVEAMLKIGKNFEANRPECVKQMYIINAGRVFTLFFALYKPIMSAATQAKTHVYNRSSKWKPVLQKNVPLDALPVAYGGSNPVFGSEGEADSDNEDESDEFAAMLLPKADKTDLIIEVFEAKSTLSWAFKTDKSDIGFVVLSKADNKAYVNEAKVASNSKLIEGSITCGAPGDYVFTFDNTKGSQAQEVQYRFDVRSTSGAKQLSFD